MMNFYNNLIDLAKYSREEVKIINLSITYNKRS